MSETAEFKFKKKLPQSKMIRPLRWNDRIKYHFWQLYTPLHPMVRDIVLLFRIMTHTGRQNFILGTIAAHKTADDVIDVLVSHGYGNHFVAWKDEGEIASLRRVIDFSYQYHVRIFNDGEVRGHFEYTPEYSPILHYRAVAQTNGHEEFLPILKDHIVLHNRFL